MYLRVLTLGLTSLLILGLFLGSCAPSPTEPSPGKEAVEAPPAQEAEPATAATTPVTPTLAPERPKTNWAQEREMVLFQDNFEDGEADGWAFADAEGRASTSGWAIEEDNGGFVLSGEGHTWAGPDIQRCPDYVIEAKIRVITGGFHFNFRLGKEDRYLMGISRDHFVLCKTWKGDWFDLDRFETALDSDKWYSVRVALKESSIKIYLDGTLIINYTDEEAPIYSGGFAFETLNDSHIHFDDVVVAGQVSPFVWTQTNGPGSGSFSAVAVDPTNPRVVYAGSNRGALYKSFDGGESWERLQALSTTHCIKSIVIDPLSPDIVYVAAWGIFKTTDGGGSWNHVTEGLDNINFHSLVMDPHNPDVLYAGTHLTDTSPRVYRTTNGGDSWASITARLPEANITAMAIVNSEEVYLGVGGPLVGGRSGELYHTTDGGKSWQKVDIGKAEDSFVSSIAVDPSEPKTVYVGLSDIFNRCWRPLEDKYLFKTTDEGNSWRLLRVHGGLDTQIQLLALSPDNGTIYLGAGGYIHKSVDAGASWDEIEFRGTESFTRGDPRSIAIDPYNPGILYLATDTGIMKTTDGGQSWRMMNKGLICATFSHIAIDPKNPDVVFAASLAGAGTFKSIDGGESWLRLDQGGIKHAWADELVIDPQNSNVVYEIADIGHIYKASDGGRTWDKINNGFRFSSIYALEVAPFNSDVFYAAKNGFGIFKSTDKGNGWTYLLGSPDYTYSIAISPSNPRITYAGYNIKPFETSAMVLKSMDGGETWEEYDLGLEHPSKNINDIVVHPLDPNIVYVAAMHNGILKTSDGGESWVQANKGLKSLDVLSLAIDPREPETVYAGLAEGVGIFKTTNGGNLWEEVNNGITIECPSYLQRVGQVSSGISLEKPASFISGDYYTVPWTIITSIAIAPADSRILYAVDFHKGVYKSTDGGRRWHLVNGANNELDYVRIRAVVIDPSNPNKLYVCSEEGVFETSDSGNSWRRRNTGLISSDIHCLAMGADGQLYSGSKGYGVFRFEQNTWVQTPELGDFGVYWPVWDRPLYQYSALLINPVDTNIMYIGTFPAGVFKSIDGGRTWVDRNLAFTNDGVMFLTFHPNTTEIIYAGTYNGVSKSTNSGESWEMISDGIPPEQWVFSIAFDPTNPDVMYAATKNGKNQGYGEKGFHGTVVKTIDGGENWFEITNGLDKNNEFYSILVDPVDPNVLFLSTQHDGVYLSTDAGESWKAFNSGLSNLNVGAVGNVSSSLRMDQCGNVLYLGTNGSGVFRLSE